MKTCNTFTCVALICICLIGCGNEIHNAREGKDILNETNHQIKRQETSGWKGTYDKTEYVPESMLYIASSPYAYIGAFEIDNNGIPYVLYSDSPQENQFYCSLFNGGKWLGLLDSSNEYNENLMPLSDSKRILFDTMRIDNNNQCHFIKWDKEGLIYMVWEGNHWISVYGSQFEHQYSSNSRVNYNIELDNKNRPHIVYRKLDSINYFYWNGEDWVTESGDLYNFKENDNPIYTSESDSKINSNISFMMDSNDNPIIIWSEYDQLDHTYIKGITRKEGKWQFLKNPSTPQTAILDLSNYLTNPNFGDFFAKVDTDDRLHLTWNQRDCSCYMFNKSSNWYNYKGEAIIAEDLSNAVVPVSIDHIDDKGYLHHVGYANDDFDLYHTMWNGQQWTSIEGRPTPPEGDEDCIFYRNYNDRPPGDFIIRTHKNNFYIAWNQWSQEGVGVGVSWNLHYMEWIEDTEAK